MVQPVFEVLFCVSFAAIAFCALRLLRNRSAHMIELNIGWEPEPEPPIPQPAYVEVEGARLDLTANDLKDIGAFTRENLEHWLFEGRNMRPSYSDFLNMMAQ
jgi:hypothetical protein